MTKREKNKINRFIKKTVKKSVWIEAAAVKRKGRGHVKVVTLIELISELNKLVKGLKNEEKQRKALSKR